ncbi:NAD(P)-binding domain-containing protein [Alphaproteobacteria bacterium]|nr:NAD(P)-binding domain-containing protein [Alphaproteobacteria bacterium]
MPKLKLGFIGLGRMGFPMAQALNKNVCITAYDIDSKKIKAAQSLGINTVKDLQSLIKAIPRPRIIWIMLPMGAIVENVLDILSGELQEGDLIVDGGNANYLDSIRRRNKLKINKIGFAGAGTSGGTSGAVNGPPITIDCSNEDYKKIQPILKLLGGNIAFFEEPGKGHLAKTLHNAIEYGMMQSLAEGIALYIKYGFTEEETRRAFKTWSSGSIIESRLVTCLNEVMNKNSILDNQKIKKSETLSIVNDILKSDCYTPILEKSAHLRKNTNKLDPVTHTVLARLREFFGGHVLRDKD